MHDLALGLRYHHCCINEEANAITLTVAIAASASTSAASPVYSKSTLWSYSRPRQPQRRVFLEVMHPEDPVKSCDKCNGREYVPLEYSSGDVEWLGECHRAIELSEAQYSVAAAKIACTMRRTLAPTPASLSASSRNI